MENFKKYFKISELVCPHVTGKYSEEQAWSFLDPRLLETLLVIRLKILGRAMVINGQSFTQRGLRCNCCQLVADKTKAGKTYMSAHTRGMAVDFSVPGMSAESVRDLICRNADKLPYPIRLEQDVNWVHFDVCNTTGRKVQYFKG